MENYIIKFKNDLRKEQTNRKMMIKHFESKISLFEQIIEIDPKLIAELSTDDIDESFLKNTIMFSNEETKKNLINLMSKKRVNKKKAKT